MANRRRRRGGGRGGGVEGADAPRTLAKCNIGPMMLQGI